MNLIFSNLVLLYPDFYVAGYQYRLNHFKRFYFEVKVAYFFIAPCERIFSSHLFYVVISAGTLATVRFIFFKLTLFLIIVIFFIYLCYVIFCYVHQAPVKTIYYQYLFIIRIYKSNRVRGRKVKSTILCHLKSWWNRNVLPPSVLRTTNVLLKSDSKVPQIYSNIVQLPY